MVVTFVTAVASDKEESVLNAVQLLWVNLIMDTFAALALATDPPTDSILNRAPDKKTAPLINTRMGKMIIGQAICQLAITLVLHFAGPTLMGYDMTNLDQQEHMKTLVFNTFVWLQIFNQLNSRRLDNHLNIFEGITRNRFYIVINLIMIGGQVLIIFVGGAAFGIRPLTGKEWGMSIGLGAISVPWGILIRKFPDAWAAALTPHIKFPKLRLRKSKKKDDLEKTSEDAEAQKSKDLATDSESERFGPPLRTLTSIRGKRASTHIRRGFREYMHDKKTQVKDKVAGGSTTNVAPEGAAPVNGTGGVAKKA